MNVFNEEHAELRANSISNMNMVQRDQNKKEH